MSCEKCTCRFVLVDWEVLACLLTLKLGTVYLPWLLTFFIFNVADSGAPEAGNRICSRHRLGLADLASFADPRYNPFLSQVKEAVTARC